MPKHIHVRFPISRSSSRARGPCTPLGSPRRSRRHAQPEEGQQPLFVPAAVCCWESGPPVLEILYLGPCVGSAQPLRGYVIAYTHVHAVFVTNAFHFMFSSFNHVRYTLSVFFGGRSTRPIFLKNRGLRLLLMRLVVDFENQQVALLLRATDDTWMRTMTGPPGHVGVSSACCRCSVDGRDPRFGYTSTNFANNLYVFDPSINDDTVVSTLGTVVL